MESSAAALKVGESISLKWCLAACSIVFERRPASNDCANLLSHSICCSRIAVCAVICFTCYARATELTSILKAMGTPSAFGKDASVQAKLHEDGKRLNCWRSLTQPLPLALLYPFFGRFSKACLNTAKLCEKDKLFVLELCTQVRRCYLLGSSGPAAPSVRMQVAPTLAATLRLSA